MRLRFEVEVEEKMEFFDGKEPQQVREVWNKRISNAIFQLNMCQVK